MFTTHIKVFDDWMTGIFSNLAKNGSGQIFFAANRQVTKTLVIGCVYGILVPSYIGIMLNHDKKPFEPITKMECNRSFEGCSIEGQ